MLGRRRKLEGAAEHSIDGSEKRIGRLSFEFRVRILLKGAVKKKQFHGIYICVSARSNCFSKEISCQDSLYKGSETMKR